ncbi:hypothetical protein Dsin_026182 [Dipteronia sinensis]|uniref:RING-type E3 ubiquitin transferase n=1 Tax=Dipteronia sinensis TaxID=43782 RepID=A0AAD9ZX58_9ROSI|nr:hypothetical protein Dsin_026182 [Dipteronia sinensis]
MLREPSVRVRETAAEQLEERQSDWAYSKPIIVLDVLWNWPLYAFHVLCVYFEYNRRGGEVSDNGFGDLRSGSGSDGGDVDYYRPELPQNEDETSLAKNLESANTMFSFLWWIAGFYWITTSGETLNSDSPQLYWLCIVFLAFDVAFVVICVAVACLIGIAVCCCLPCILGILYA